MTHKKTFDFKKNSNYIIFTILGFALILSLIITSLFLTDKNSSLDTSSKAAINTPVLLSFNQNNITPDVDEEFSLEFRAKPQNTIDVKQYDIQIEFDSTKIRVKDVNYQVGDSTGNGTDGSQSKIDEANTKGSISLSGSVSNASGFKFESGKLTTLAAIKFKRLNPTYNEVNVPNTRASFIIIENDGTLKLITAAIAQVLKILDKTTQTSTIYLPATNTPADITKPIFTPINSPLPTYTPQPTGIRYSENPYSPIPLTPPTYTVIVNQTQGGVKKTTVPTPTTIQQGKPGAGTASPTTVVSGTIKVSESPTLSITPTNDPATPVVTPTKKVIFTGVSNVASPIEIVIWGLIILITTILILLAGAFGYNKFKALQKKD